MTGAPPLTLLTGCHSDSSSSAGAAIRVPAPYTTVSESTVDRRLARWPKRWRRVAMQHWNAVLGGW